MPSQYEHGPDFQTWNEAEISRLSSENETLRSALKLAGFAITSPRLLMFNTD